MTQPPNTPAAGEGTPAPAAGAPAAGAPAPAATPGASSVPESYPLALPKDSLLDPAALTRITEKAKALKVTDAAMAQAFVDVAQAEAAEVIRVHEASRKAGGAFHAAVVQQNEAAALAHPELGAGDPRQLEVKALRASLLLAEYAPDLAPILKETGFANRPEVLLFLNRMHDRMSEKPLATGAGSPSNPAGSTLGGQFFPGGFPKDTVPAKPS